jgi:lysophospholipase L1-like esterase
MVSRIYMKNILLFIGFISLGLTTAAKIQTTLIMADHPYIQYIGRFDFTDKTQPVFMYSGCMIRAAFTGTSLVIRLKDDSLRNWFTVKLDDSIFIFKANSQTGIYQLTANLTNKKHTVEISRRTEWHGGNSTFIGFIIDQGTTLLPLKKYNRSIEFIGNSITCGYGNEGESNKEHFEYATENNYLSASAVTARALNASYIAVCRSGIGMYQGYGGKTDFTQPLLYDEVVTGSKIRWDYKNNQPDLVVIELGSNDLSAPLDTRAFVQAYYQFVKKIRHQYTKAKIIFVAGTEVPGEKWEKYQSIVKASYSKINSIDKNVFYFAFSPFVPNGSDWHPNVSQDRKMADELIAFINKITNWQMNNN